MVLMVEGHHSQLNQTNRQHQLLGKSSVNGAEGRSVRLWPLTTS